MNLLAPLMTNHAALFFSLAALGSSLLCWIAVSGNRAHAQKLRRQIPADFAAELERCNSALLERLDEAERKVEAIESRIPEVGGVRGGIGRTDRSRAMQLLRTGLAPATVASSLNLELREIQLIGAVSQVLSRHAGESEPHVAGADGR